MDGRAGDRTTRSPALSYPQASIVLVSPNIHRRDAEISSSGLKSGATTARSPPSRTATAAAVRCDGHRRMPRRAPLPASPQKTLGGGDQKQQGCDAGVRPARQPRSAGVHPLPELGERERALVREAVFADRARGVRAAADARRRLRPQPSSASVRTRKRGGAEKILSAPPRFPRIPTAYATRAMRSSEWRWCGKPSSAPRPMATSAGMRTCAGSPSRRFTASGSKPAMGDVWYPCASADSSR